MNDIDTLGRLLDEAAVLTEDAEKIKKGLKETASLGGTKVFEGEIYVAKFSESNRSTVDWKALTKELAIPAELIARHTKVAAVYTIKVEKK
jgi:hypothetical protein